MSSREHLMKLIDLLYNECASAGGDGDALWYSRYYRVTDILPLVKEYNSKLKFPSEIKIIDNNIHWGDNQEDIMITNNKDWFDTAPDWIQMKVIY